MKKRNLVAVILCMNTFGISVATRPHLAVAKSSRGQTRVPVQGVIASRNEGEADMVAYLGKKNSTNGEDQRSVLYVLSNLISAHPKATAFQIDWESVDGRGHSRRKSVHLIDTPTEQSFQTEDLTYNAVTRKLVQVTARQNGTFHDLTRHGAVGETVELDLGTYPSYNAGSRATMSVLAQRLRSPFNAEYHIVWKYKNSDAKKVRAEVSYSPVFEKPFDVECSIQRILTFGHDDERDTILSTSYRMVTKRAIQAVARRSGNFKDLLKFGAKIR